MVVHDYEPFNPKWIKNKLLNEGKLVSEVVHT